MANGTRTSFTYDPANQNTLLSNLTSEHIVISSFDYQHDSVGNRTRMEESNGDRVTWTYDSAYQLVAERRSGANAYAITHTYDAVGNQTSETHDGQRVTFTYDVAHQLVTSLDSSGPTTYNYDASGNQHSVHGPNGDRTTYTWDYENRTSQVELSSAQIVTMHYQPHGLRVRKDASAGTTKFIWDGQNYLAETDANDATVAVYTNEPHPYGKLVSQHRGTTTSYYHFDAIASTRQISDIKEIISDSFSHTAFGTPIAISGTTKAPFQFIGEFGYYFDLETNDSYVRARIYSPTLIRWLSRDPLVAYFPETPPYNYATNSPVRLVDVMGLQAKDKDCCQQCLDIIKDSDRWSKDDHTGRLIRRVLNCNPNIFCSDSCGAGGSGPLTGLGFIDSNYYHICLNAKELRKLKAPTPEELAMYKPHVPTRLKTKPPFTGLQWCVGFFIHEALHAAQAYGVTGPTGAPNRKLCHPKKEWTGRNPVPRDLKNRNTPRVTTEGCMACVNREYPAYKRQAIFLGLMTKMTAIQMSYFIAIGICESCHHACISDRRILITPGKEPLRELHDNKDRMRYLPGPVIAQVDGKWKCKGFRDFPDIFPAPKGKS